MRSVISCRLVSATLVVLLVAACSSSDPFAEGASPSFVADATPDTAARATGAGTETSVQGGGDPAPVADPVASSDAPDTVAPPPTVGPAETVPPTVTPDSPPLPPTITRTKTPSGSGGSGTKVSGPTLVSKTPQPQPLQQPTADCAAPLPDEPCTLPETGSARGSTPNGFSIGEYEINVTVPRGRILNVYFDQSRTYDDMNTRCHNMGGVLVDREDDGSKWAGWYFCADVNY